MAPVCGRGSRRRCNASGNRVGSSKVAKAGGCAGRAVTDPTKALMTARDTMSIEVDGRPQPMLVAGLLAARMACGFDHAAEALIVLDLPTPLDGEAAAAVLEAVRLGRTVRLGLGDASPAFFSGEIVAVTQDLRADRAPRLEIAAQDHLAALGRTTVTRAYHDQTPLEAIRAVAARHQPSLAGDIGDGGRREAIVQAGESDLDFIRRLARELDVGLVADEAGGLRLVRRGAAAAPARARRDAAGTAPRGRRHSAAGDADGAGLGSKDPAAAHRAGHAERRCATAGNVAARPGVRGRPVAGAGSRGRRPAAGAPGVRQPPVGDRGWDLQWCRPAPTGRRCRGRRGGAAGGWQLPDRAGEPRLPPRGRLANGLRRQPPAAGKPREGGPECRS